MPEIIKIAQRKRRKKRKKGSGRPRKYKPPTVMYPMRLYVNEKRDWERAALIMGLTLATMIRLAMRRFMRNPVEPKFEERMAAGVYRRSWPQMKKLAKRVDMGFGGRNLETHKVRDTKENMAKRQMELEEDNHPSKEDMTDIFRKNAHLLAKESDPKPKPFGERKRRLIVPIQE